MDLIISLFNIFPSLIPVNLSLRQDIFNPFSQGRDEQLDGVGHGEVQQGGRQRPAEVGLEEPAEL